MDNSTILSDGVNNQQLTKVERVSVPLAVDLDGTLIRTDSLIESLIPLLKTNPLLIVALLFWLARGKAYLKQQIAKHATLDISSLPYNLDILNFLRDQHNSNRTLILATGADQHTAQQIADYLHVFDSVIASNGKNNLTGVGKKERLVTEFGVKGFDYLGNDLKDIFMWQAARRALVVGSKSFIDRIHASLTNVELVFEEDTAAWSDWVQSLRLYQWLKNLLIFVPLLADHRLNEASLLLLNCVAFLSFGLCASSVYLLNDLLDLPEDRRHPRKRFRPFASGMVPLHAGFIAALLLLGTSIVIALPLPPAFLLFLGTYYLITLAYSFRLKNIVILDVIVLAGLFTHTHAGRFGRS